VSTVWSDRARSLVSEWQERAWGQLAEDLGLGWQPAQAFERFASPRLAHSDHRLSVERLQSTLGQQLPAAQRAELERSFTEYKKRYYDITPPTRFEDHSIYSNALATVDTLLPLIGQVLPGRLTSAPLVATIPTGRLNATIRRIRGTDEVVILLQQGLTGFLYHFSNALACAIPWSWLFGEMAVPAPEGNPWRMERAAAYLIDLIDAYVIRGDPYQLPEPQLAGADFRVGSYLSSVARQFVIGHEIMHLVFGDLDEARGGPRSPAESRNRELASDDAAAALVARLFETHSDPPVRWGTTVWACTVPLMGFQLLVSWVSFLTTGSLETPESDTHPSPERRRKALLQTHHDMLAAHGRPGEAARLERLTRDGVDAIQDLWHRTWPHVEGLYDSGAAPSPIWRTRDVPRSEAVTR
jgi:hypothetical protein